VQEMEALCDLVEVDTGELILDEGQPPEHFYILCRYMRGAQRHRSKHYIILFHPCGN
jgi:hypothetical protein